MTPILNESRTSDLMKKINGYSEGKVEVPRIKHGKTQTLDTLINEEALLFARYLRKEKERWNPRE